MYLQAFFFRSSDSGSAVQLKNWAMSRACWEMVASVPSSYSTPPSLSGGGHRYRSTRKVGIVVKSGHHFLTGGCIAVSGQEGKHVIRTVVSGLDHQAQIGRVCTTVGSTASLFVSVWGWNHVVRFPGALEHLPLVVGTVHNIHVLRHLLHFLSCVGNSNELSESYVLQRVTGGANLTVYLVSTAKGGVVKGRKISLVAPRIMRGMDDVLFVHQRHRYR